MAKCEKCVYRKNCQFLATHKKTIVEDCSVFENENKIKSEAIKEFAEKAQSKLIKYPSEFRSAVYWDIHDTMKELMGE